MDGGSKDTFEGVTGWAVGEQHLREAASGASARHESCLYQKLEDDVIPSFYHHRDRFIEMMRHAIALNGSFFNTQRMLHQYVLGHTSAELRLIFPARVFYSGTA